MYTGIMIKIVVMLGITVGATYIITVQGSEWVQSTNKSGEVDLPGAGLGHPWG